MASSHPCTTPSSIACSKDVKNAFRKLLGERNLNLQTKTYFIKLMYIWVIKHQITYFYMNKYLQLLSTLPNTFRSPEIVLALKREL